MSMFLAVIQAVFALAVSLGRWGPQGLLKLTAKADRRMHLVESLTLDAQRRLVLVRLDAKEHLILLGEGRVVQASELEAPRG
jgi:hypothetical protein